MELSHMAAALVRFYLAKEAVIEYLDRLVQRDLDRTGESKVLSGQEGCHRVSGQTGAKRS